MNIESALSDSANIFDLAPISLWLEDYSGLRRQFEEWRAQGVTDLGAFLHEDTSRLRICTSHIRVLKVNRKTLSLFEADSVDHLVTNLERVFRDDMLDPHIDEMVQLWNGGNAFSSDTINYTLNGKRLDIQLKGVVLPGYEHTWERVLLSIEDVTARENARREQDRHKRHAQGLFEHSPVSLWVEDFSAIRQLLEEVRSQGITDFRVFTDVHPEFVERCMSEIRVLDVNQATLELFGAKTKDDLLKRQSDILRDSTLPHFREQLIDLWNGRLFQRREVVNYSLEGEEIHVLMQFSVLPGHEADWALVQVALTDITARKKAEAYLEFLGKHDVLTKLYNRSFYVDELNRIDRKGTTPVSVIMVDVNGLKAANDLWGHAAGDGLLRRAGEVLGKSIEKPACASRIGGDEFALLLPGVDDAGAALVVANLEKLVVLNNQFYPGLPLNLAIGRATRFADEPIEETIKRADLQMYRSKKDYYEAEVSRSA